MTAPGERPEAAAADFHDEVCTGPGVPAGFTCTHPHHQQPWAQPGQRAAANHLLQALAIAQGRHTEALAELREGMRGITGMLQTLIDREPPHDAT